MPRYFIGSSKGIGSAFASCTRFTVKM